MRFRSDDKIPMSDRSDVRTDTVVQHTCSFSGKIPPIVLSAANIQPISILRIAKPTLQAMGIKVKQDRPEYIKTKYPIRSSYCTCTITIRNLLPYLDIRITSVILC
uniref:AlNc14C797G12526 protein n=1 Tax=Albugo laibachii Nc14 TaxID=890382 RepID=F0X228_9STRA|nr:AlNc14C797G12526 [Albugo laibachii Nc14]|eukprot:CCA27893.1 AlNc14C797G12526 [Albugo laibachii Nc14]